MSQRLKATILLAGTLIGAALVLIPSPGNKTAAEPHHERRRWALVSTDAQSAALAELLTVELSQRPDVELVERAEIQRVLDELQLQAGGLADAAGVQRFGTLTGADAILLLERMAQTPRSGVRLRLVETRTSVRLLDQLLPGGAIEKEVQAIRAVLKRGSDKLAIPEQRRRYVGVLMIKSEEPGEALKPFCRTLTALVEAELQRHPEVIVLERGQLQRLTAERDLTGAELKLRSAARLLEAGVRRTEGNAGLAIACRWLFPASGSQETMQIESDSPEIRDVLGLIVASAEQTLGTKGPSEPRDLAAEAAVFAGRRDMFDNAYRFEDAAEMAEAALALAPTPENLNRALRSYSSWRHSADGVLHSHEALSAARRLAELRLAWFRKTQPGSALRHAIDVACPFRLHVRIPVKPESAEDRRLRAETDALCVEFFDAVYAEAADPDRRLELLLHRLEYAAYLAETGEEFTTSLPDLIVRIKSLYREIGEPMRFGSPRYAEFTRALAVSLRQSSTNCDRSGRGTDQRDWERADVAGLWKKLAADEDPVMRAAGLYALATAPGKEATGAAKALLAIVQDWPLIDNRPLDLGGEMAYSALSRVADPLAAQEFVERLLKQAEEQGDAKRLAGCVVVPSAFERMPPERVEDWCQRALKVVDRTPATPDPLQSMRLASFRGFLESCLKRRGHPPASTKIYVGPNPPLPSHTPPTDAELPFSLADGPGPWPQYVARPLAIRKAPRHEGLATVLVDRLRDADARGGELVLAWGHRPEGVAVERIAMLVRETDGGAAIWSAGHLAIERVSLRGGPPRRVGPVFPGGPAPFHGVQLAIGPDAVFVASGTPGIVTVRDKVAEVCGEQQGAPATHVFSLGWYKDRLYIGFRDAFAAFDPAAKSFRLLASSVSVEPRNDIDGRGSFFVTQILPDEDHDCLWLCVQDNALPRARNGVWRFSPERDHWQRLDENPVTSGRTDEISWGEGGPLWYLSHRKSWMQVGAGTGRASALTGYATWTPATRLRSAPWRFVKVGSHIISGDGQLFTPDGAEHRLQIDAPWTLLQRVGPGFITHFDPKTNLLWYVEPKAVGVSPDRQPSAADSAQP